MPSAFIIPEPQTCGAETLVFRSAVSFPRPGGVCARASCSHHGTEVVTRDSNGARLASVAAVPLYPRLHRTAALVLMARVCRIQICNLALVLFS